MKLKRFGVVIWIGVILVPCGLIHFWIKMCVLLLFIVYTIWNWDWGRWPLFLLYLWTIGLLLSIYGTWIFIVFNGSFRSRNLIHSYGFLSATANCPIWWGLTMIEHFHWICLKRSINCWIRDVGFWGLRSATVDSCSLKMVGVITCWSATAFLLHKRVFRATKTFFRLIQFRSWHLIKL